jgi:hypothetical protein
LLKIDKARSCGIELNEDVSPRREVWAVPPCSMAGDEAGTGRFQVVPGVPTDSLIGAICEQVRSP